MRLFAAAAIAVLLSSGCRQQPSLAENLVRDAVRATIQAIPSCTPAPLPSANPSTTAVPLSGLFCEYEFCIGHPKGLAFFDVVAKQNPATSTASSYDAGIVATHGLTTFIEMIWQAAPNTPDPAYLLDLVLEAGADTPVGQLEVLTLDITRATYVVLRTNATELLPHGIAAAWTCGNRGFAWKAYSNQPEFPRLLLDEALRGFRCEQ